MEIKKVMDSKFGSIVISILLGVGLAALFRTACKDGKCIVIESPPKEDMKYYYKLDDSCYKYNAVPTKCEQV